MRLFSILIGMGGHQMYQEFGGKDLSFREVLRYPNREVWSKIDFFVKEHSAILLLPPRLVTESGAIKDIEKISGNYELRGQYTSGLLRKRDMTVIELDGGRRYIYPDNFFGEIGDNINLKIAKESFNSHPRVKDFLDGLHRFEEEHRIWRSATIGFKNIPDKTPQTIIARSEISFAQLKHLDGIIEDYELIKN